MHLNYSSHILVFWYNSKPHPVLVLGFNNAKPDLKLCVPKPEIQKWPGKVKDKLVSCFGSSCYYAYCGESGRLAHSVKTPTTGRKAPIISTPPNGISVFFKDPL